MQNPLRAYRTFLDRPIDGGRVLGMVIVTLAVYAYMLLVSIPKVMAFSGGMKLFDMLPAGYTVEYARELLERLGVDGRNAYLTHQIPVDMVYPALFAISYSLLLVWVLRKAAGRTNWIFWLSLLPVGAGLFDYLENVGIIGMLWMFPEMPATLIVVSSGFSVVKAVLTTVFFVVLIGGGVGAVVRGRRGGKKTQSSC